MNKEDLYLDCDDTIIQSNRRFGELYNEAYKYHPDFIKAHGELEYKWGFVTQCPLLQKGDMERFFNDERFFEGVQFYNGAKEAILTLSEMYNIKIPSMGWSENLKHKDEFFKLNFDGAVEFIPIDFEKNGDKRGIDMSDGIFVDDNAKYLFSSNAKNKICFGNIYEWNEAWNGLRVKNWKALEVYLKLRYYRRHAR